MTLTIAHLDHMFVLTVEYQAYVATIAKRKWRMQLQNGLWQTRRNAYKRRMPLQLARIESDGGWPAGALYRTRPQSTLQSDTQCVGLFFFTKYVSPIILFYWKSINFACN